MALLVAVTSFLAAVFPRAVDSYEGEGLRHELRNAAPGYDSIRMTAATAEAGDVKEQAAALEADHVAERFRGIVSRLPKLLRADVGESAYGARNMTPSDAANAWLPQLEGGGPVFTVSAQAGLAEHATLRAGRWPASDGASPTADRVEAAVTTATAKTLNIKAGATIRLPREGGAKPLAITVTAIVEPLRPDGDYWSFDPVLRTPAKLYGGKPPQPYWHGGLLLAPKAAPALMSLRGDTEVYWGIAIDPSGLVIGDLPGLKSAVASVKNGPALSALRSDVDPTLVSHTNMDGLLLDFERALGAIAPVVAVAAVGAGAVGAVVLLMGGGLAAARRHRELALLRSRGGSLSGIGGRLLAEVAVPAVPAAAAGCALALALAPEGRLLPSLLASGAVAVLACAALPLRAVRMHRVPRLHDEREDAGSARPSRRRTVAELTLLALTVAAAAALRRRGTGGGTDGNGVDGLVSAAPVLVGMAAALVLVRLYPLPLRLLARPVARRRGAIGFLSLTRAGRAPVTTALPLLALLVALTTAAFGGSVLAGVADVRDRAALLAVGADARVENLDGLPEGLAEKVRALPGVRDAVTVQRHFDVDLMDSDQDMVTLLAVEPAAYARLSRAMGQGAFDAERLRRSSGVLPALATPAVATRLGDGPATIGTPDGAFSVQVAEVRTATPAMGEGDFLVVDAAGLPERRPATTLLVSGPSVPEAALRKAAEGAGTVLLRSVEREGFTDSPVQRGGERIYAVAAAAGAGYAALAVLLSLIRAAPERVALLARLRTMGLTRRQGRRLLILENLPQTLLAGAGGALVGQLAIGLLAPGVDLARLALAGRARIDSLGPVELRADLWSLLLPALAVVVLAAGVAAVQAWVTTRRTTTTELRVGDTR